MDSIDQLSIEEQYGASLKMLEDLIKRCNDTLWNDINQKPSISNVIYHILNLIDIHLKLNESVSKNPIIKKELFMNWENSSKKHEKQDVLFYLNEIREKVYDQIKITFNKDLFNEQKFLLLSILFSDLSHIMLHVGELHIRLN